jgi:hypothetical protein
VTTTVNPEDLYVEFEVKHKNGRTWITTSDGESVTGGNSSAGNSICAMEIVRALVRGHMWRREIERGKYESIRDFARKNRIDEAYFRRMLKLNYLSPQIKEIILSGKLPKHIIILDLTSSRFPTEWTEQLAALRRLWS